MCAKIGKISKFDANNNKVAIIYLRKKIFRPRNRSLICTWIVHLLSLFQLPHRKERISRKNENLDVNGTWNSKNKLVTPKMARTEMDRRTYRINASLASKTIECPLNMGEKHWKKVNGKERKEIDGVDEINLLIKISAKISGHTKIKLCFVVSSAQTIAFINSFTSFRSFHWICNEWKTSLSSEIYGVISFLVKIIYTKFLV